MNDTMKDRLTAATLRSIEERRGVQGLSLRGIAREAGCSHVNVYHYAPRGIPDLLWLAFTVGLEDFTRACSERTAHRREGENFGEAMARAILGFALGREGVYRLLWFEALEGRAEGEALLAIERSKRAFRESADAFSLADSGAPVDEYAEELDILFAYLQGEIALMLNGRSEPDRRAAREAIAARAGRMWSAVLRGAAASPPRARPPVS